MATGPFQKPSNLFQQQIHNMFVKKTPKEGDQILRLVSIILNANSNNTDLVDIYNLLGVENFARLIHLLDGRVIKLPTSTEIEETIALAFIYYYREVKEMKWEEVVEAIPFEISTISYGSKVKSLTAFMRNKIEEMMTEELKNE